MTLGFRLTQKQSQTLALNQKLVLGLKVLEMTQREVDAAVGTFEEQNLLDTVSSTGDEQLDPRTLETNGAVEALAKSSTDGDDDLETTDFIATIGQANDGAVSRASGDAEWTPEDYLAAPGNFRERILAQLIGQRLSKHQLRIATFIVEALDSRGFFIADIEECSETCGASAEELSQVLGIVQQCEPAGVAARNPWEAIRLALERNGCANSAEWSIASCIAQLVETGELQAIIAGASSMMSNTDYESVALKLLNAVSSRLGIDETHVRQILKRLLKAVPHPIEQHEEDVTPWAGHHVQAVEEINPDVAISASSDGGFTVELCGSRYANLSVSKTLLAEIDDLKERIEFIRKKENLPGEAAAKVKNKIVQLTFQREQREECREHVMQFLRACEDRRTTLLRVATVLAQRQKAYLKSERISDLQCFSPDEAGAELQLEEFGGQSLSESTVGRALQDKLVRLPSGAVKPLKILCSPGEKATTTDGLEARYLPEIVKDWILDYIRHEDCMNPLSDDSIAKIILRNEDLKLSRKTIENYRKDLEIPSARERKRRPAAMRVEVTAVIATARKELSI
jgi:RNA polymerase sigma-54 factor